VRRIISCRSCGKSAEYAPCSERGAVPEDARCNVLRGWLTVVRWRGRGHTDQHNFCSLNCLLKWAEAQVPQIPKTFLDAFEDGQNK